MPFSGGAFSKISTFKYLSRNEVLGERLTKSSVAVQLFSLVLPGVYPPLWVFRAKRGERLSIGSSVCTRRDADQSHSHKRVGGETLTASFFERGDLVFVLQRQRDVIETVQHVVPATLVDFE